MKTWPVAFLAAALCALPITASAATPPDACTLASAADVAAAVSGPTGRGKASSDPEVFNTRSCRWTGADGRWAEISLHTNPAMLKMAKSVEGAAAKPMNGVAPGAFYAEGKIAFVKHGYYVVVQTVNPVHPQSPAAATATPEFAKFAAAVARRL